MMSPGHGSPVPAVNTGWFYSTRKSEAQVACGNGELRGGGSHRDKLVFFNLRGDSGSAVFIGFHAHHAPVAADIYVPSGNNLLRKRQNKIDFAAVFKTAFAVKVKSAIADVARVSFQFRAVGI